MFLFQEVPVFGRGTIGLSYFVDGVKENKALVWSLSVMVGSVVIRAAECALHCPLSPSQYPGGGGSGVRRGVGASCEAPHVTSRWRLSPHNQHPSCDGLGSL